MPTPTTQNDYTIGQNTAVVFSNDLGQRFTAEELGLLMEIEWEIDDEENKITPISHGGRSRYKTIYHGVKGRCRFARLNGNLEAVFAQMTRRFRESGLQTHWSIGLTIINPDASEKQIQFIECVFSGFKGGGFQANKEVDQSFNFRGQTFEDTSGVATRPSI